MTVEKLQELLAKWPPASESYTDNNAWCMKVARILKEIYVEQNGGACGLHSIALTLARIGH